MIEQRNTLAAAALLMGLLSGGPALAQAFGPGPAGTPVGSSMSGLRIGPQKARRPHGIPNADPFGDEAEERAFGRDYDDSYLRPRIGRSRDPVSNEERATEGRSDLNDVNAGAFATEGPDAIGASPVTRPSLRGGSRGGRARIVLPPGKR